MEHSKTFCKAALYVVTISGKRCLFLFPIDNYRNKYYPLSETQLPVGSEEVQSKSKIEHILAARHTIQIHRNPLEITKRKDGTSEID